MIGRAPTPFWGRFRQILKLFRYLEALFCAYSRRSRQVRGVHTILGGIRKIPYKFPLIFALKKWKSSFQNLQMAITFLAVVFTKIQNLCMFSCLGATLCGNSEFWKGAQKSCRMAQNFGDTAITRATSTERKSRRFDREFPGNAWILRGVSG